MDYFLDILQKVNNWKELMRSSCKQNHLNTLMAVDLTILKLRKIHNKLKKSNMSNCKSKNSWIENQLRAFNWILIAVSGVQKIIIQDFGQQQWKLMQDIFQTKDLIFLKFEAKKLIAKKQKNKKAWDIQQQQQLYRYAKQYDDQQRIPWNQIALKMFANSNGTTFRQGKHCRQHWLNYLDPTKARGKWTLQQDIYLIQSVNQGNKKWCQCAIYLKRTQHSVKNRYNSLLTKYRKQNPLKTKQNKLLRDLLAYLKSLKLNQNYQQQQQYIKNSSIKLQQKQKQKQNESFFNDQQDKIQQIEQINSNINSEDNEYNDNQNLENLINNNHVHDDNNKQKIVQQYEQKIQHEDNNKPSNLCYNFNFGNYIKEDIQQKNFPQYPILSPFIYSPSPTNYLSSPVFIIKQPTVYSGFLSRFSIWGNHINMPMQFITKKPQNNNNQ